MDCAYMMLCEQSDVILAEDHIMRSEQIRAEATSLLQPCGRAHPVICQAETDLVLMLAEMGMHPGVKICSRFRCQAEKLFRAGHHLTDPEPDPDPSVTGAVPDIIKFSGPADVFLGGTLHTVRYIAAHIHGGTGDNTAHTAFHSDFSGAFHVRTSGVGKSGSSTLDHLQRGELTGDSHVLFSHAALKRDQKTGPDHGIFVDGPRTEQLLGVVMMRIHKSGHGQQSLAGKDLICCSGKIFPDGRNAPITDGDIHVVQDPERGVQQTDCFDHQVVVRMFGSGLGHVRLLSR